MYDGIKCSSTFSFVQQISYAIGLHSINARTYKTIMCHNEHMKFF